MNKMLEILIKREEYWREAQQTIVQLGNRIPTNDFDCADIQDRLYNWSDEALARLQECKTLAKIAAKEEKNDR